jgi:hypothetical protein
MNPSDNKISGAHYSTAAAKYQAGTPQINLASARQLKRLFILSIPWVHRQPGFCLQANQQNGKSSSSRSVDNN